MLRLPKLAALVIVIAVPARAQSSRNHPNRADAWGRDESAFDTTLSFSRTGTITVTSAAGDIVVTASSRDEVHVRAKDGRARVRLEGASGRLAIDAADRASDDVAFEVTVPIGVRIIARSDDGDITVRGTAGDVDAHTQSGAIHVRGATGRIDLNTLSGDIEGTDLKGSVSAHGVSADITLTRVAGDLIVETVSGDVTLRDVTSKSVRAHSTSGDVTFDGAIDPVGRYELGSNSSNVSITIPPAASARISVATWNGSVESDFPIPVRPGDRATNVGGARQFSFTVGGGGATISLETFSGDIVIHRRPR